MKKVIAICMVVVFLGLNMHVSALKPNTAVKSDIRAFIDYTPIDSYLINGYTYIAAEQLVHYGFDVSYDDDSHSINISRRKFATPIYTKEMWNAFVSKQVGADIIESDIQVYLDGQIADSYAIQGNVLIMFDELQRYGTVEWDQYSRRISATIFKDELKRELENTEGVIETEYQSVDSGYIPAKYIGQVDENNLPNGIGV